MKVMKNELFSQSYSFSYYRAHTMQGAGTIDLSAKKKKKKFWFIPCMNRSYMSGYKPQIVWHFIFNMLISSLCFIMAFHQIFKLLLIWKELPSCLAIWETTEMVLGVIHTFHMQLCAR